MTMVVRRWSDEHRVLVVLKGSGFKRPKSIAFILGMPRTRAQTALLGLLRKGLVERPERGRYHLVASVTYAVAG